MTNLKTTKIEAGDYSITNTDTGNTYEAHHDLEHSTYGDCWVIEKINGDWINGDFPAYSTLKEIKATIAAGGIG